MAGWSYFTAVSTKLPGGGWLSTMPMTCPRCLLPWSDEGLRAIRGNVQRGWGSPPTGTSTVFYECQGCGHCAYDDCAAEYR